MIGADNTTLRSEGPLAGWRLQQSRPCGSKSFAGRLGRCQPEWHQGMRPVDCPGESRMIEKVTSGLGRGCWKRSRATHGDGLSPQRETLGIGIRAYRLYSPPRQRPTSLRPNAHLTPLHQAYAPGFRSGAIVE